ncbi:hypothetical protein JOD54_006376 [Actinokineospora baliensis]|nr:hypothetical protein [Actinokineospora baliensis]
MWWGWSGWRGMWWGWSVCGDRSGSSPGGDLATRTRCGAGGLDGANLFCAGPLRQPWQDRKAGAEKHGPAAHNATTAATPPKTGPPHRAVCGRLPSVQWLAMRSESGDWAGGAGSVGWVWVGWFRERWCQSNPPEPSHPSRLPLLGSRPPTARWGGLGLCGVAVSVALCAAGPCFSAPALRSCHGWRRGPAQTKFAPSSTPHPPRSSAMPQASRPLKSLVPTQPTEMVRLAGLR